MKKAIATPPGQPTEYVDLAPNELSEVEAKEAEWQAEQAKDKRTLIEKISDAFAELPKDSRKKLRKFITEGFVALQAGNMVSVQDIFEDASAVATKPEEQAFLQQIQAVLPQT